MSEAKDPAIKLFGKTIQAPAADSRGVPPPQLPSSDDAAFDGFSEDPHSSPEAEDNKSNKLHEEPDSEKDSLGEKLTDAKKDEATEHLTVEDCTDPNATSMIDDNPKTPSVDNETVKASKTEEEQSESSNSQEKTLKKPDKIIPCPRCNSMDTKFCYYNNYNVNQPRHFCKKCQRYWTAGGTMRNVPVGAGRRKNKNSVSHYRQISVSEALQSARLNLPSGLHHPAVNSNGTVLAFGSDSPLCESMTSVLKIAEKTMQNCSQNGFHKPEESRRLVSNGEDHSSGSSITAANSNDDSSRAVLNEPEQTNFTNCPIQVPYFPPWPYPWNPAQFNSPAPMPAFCPPPGFPMPFYPPSPYWGCTVPGSWNVRWIAPPPNGGAPASGPTSPTLGKHSRDENAAKSRTGEEEPQKENNPEKCLWFPKTLRIDDPGEAAKSSIWATLGIQNDKDDSHSGGGSLFKAFRSKGDEKNHINETCHVLQANPAALSRSLNFHESS